MQESKYIESLRQELIQRIAEQQQAALSFLFSYPVTTVAALAKHCELSFTQAQTLLDEFVTLNIVQQDTQAHEQLFVFKCYLDLLEHDEM